MVVRFFGENIYSKVRVQERGMIPIVFCICVPVFNCTLIQWWGLGFFVDNIHVIITNLIMSSQLKLRVNDVVRARINKYNDKGWFDSSNP